ncbi:cytochrome o ubiquinol oxidase subunit III [Commensalibacter nepenthis]|uniref:Cytochrome bo(3) ubiquinol oxidase subunit 3 n=1 Tax=Commensalibacter nepenthis TaxID=3043872 RepID=A0ABT6Q9F9_9PROT|nr:cytochrome o ubiquinol oxidase subunit III [Commensalibacter sp. TBRC 10068]MDI2113541.1 cytochrome o ubiquinol oxidase subunit III [Commensalibacter sp. TBRC 10068]
MSENSTMTANSGHHEHEHENHSVFGFWLYLMSDCVIFGCLFASYAVLHGQFFNDNITFKALMSKGVIEWQTVAYETALLLLSSLTFGFAMLSAHKGNKSGTLLWMVVSAVLGAGFLGLEINEFMHLIAHGATPESCAHWSAFFTLVGTHGLHVTLGLIWMIVLMVQVATKGVNSKMMPRLTCLSLFWHFLDIIWICVFSFVYLLSMV